jgi:Asp-tRNA(Asn)/Glu-tRNA(Gln) amidotransferase A subunit family amidase
MIDLQKADAVATATAIKNGEISAKAVVSAALERIATHDQKFQ